MREVGKVWQICVHTSYAFPVNCMKIAQARHQFPLNTKYDLDLVTGTFFYDEGSLCELREVTYGKKQERKSKDKIRKREKRKEGGGGEEEGGGGGG